MVASKIILWVQRIAVIVGVLLVVFIWNTKGKEMPFREFLFPSTPVMKIGDVSLRVEIVQTDAERMQGLSGREGLEEGEGMLFVFPEADYHAMWMKDMKFPIDIIWISEDLRVVDISEDVDPNTFPKKFRPMKPVKYAIETNEHYVETFSIHEGQTVKLPVKYIEN